MDFDIHTMLIPNAFITVMSGGLLVFARFQYRDAGPILWWAASYFAAAAGIFTIAISGNPPAGPLAITAFALLAFSTALVWSAARRLCGLRASHWLTFGPPALIVPAALVSPLPVAMTAGLITTVLGAGYLLAAAWSFGFGAREHLLARWPLFALCVLHVAAWILTGFSQMPADQVPPWLAPIFMAINFEGPVFVLGTAIFVVAWARESNELRHKVAADTDVLTGLASRRAFLSSAERVLERCRISRTPCAVIVFDLDHFKTINDTFGHQVGDRVLETFATAINRSLRPQDVIGRIGGEEFAAIAGGSDIAVGVILAERVRKAFAEAAQTIDGLTINGTLSAGVSALAEGDNLSAILRRADSALYRSKLRGRNRVEAISGEDPAPQSNVVRVA